MTYRGRVENGTIVLDEAVVLPEGAEVTVDFLESKGDSTEDKAENGGFSRYEHYKDIIGKAEGLPPDASRNKYHYLYGGPKV